jgi:hypothetical protein
VWLAAGRVCRLLVRVLLVLGGAFAVTVLGWLLCAGSANAAELPTVPSVPSVLAGVDSTVAQVSTPDIRAPKLASSPLPDNTLPDPGLGKVTQQVHLTTIGVGDRVTPAVPRASDLVAAVVPAGHAQPAKPVTRAVTRPVAVTPAPPTVSVPHRHVVQQQVRRTVPQRSAPAPSGVGPHLPALPPLQPAGSSDSNAHGAGGVAGGSGGAQSSVTHVIGGGLNLAGTPSTPRIAVAPGQQPGTSPD